MRILFSIAISATVLQIWSLKEVCMLYVAIVKTCTDSIRRIGAIYREHDHEDQERYMFERQEELFFEVNRRTSRRFQ